MDAACLPSQFWGLDPVFRSHVKLFIKDVNSLKQIDGYPGIFQYRTHPIVRVDVQGVVVRLENRPRFFVYTVDDGTGVINCTSWKQENMEHGRKQIHGLNSALASILSQINDAEGSSGEGHHLGDMLNVRGKVRVFRDHIEVMASYCAKVTDPNKETERMLVLPTLYTECYDKPAVLPRAIAEGSSDGDIDQICRVYDTETTVLTVATNNNWVEFSKVQLLKADKIKELLAKSTNSNSLLDRALTSLDKGGHIFRKASGTTDIYIMTALCKKLDTDVVQIIKEWTQNKGGEEDCPAHHIYRELNKRLFYNKLEQSALYQCLEKLEGQSDIISTAEKRYIVFNDT